MSKSHWTFAHYLITVIKEKYWKKTVNSTLLTGHIILWRDREISAKPLSITCKSLVHFLFFCPSGASRNLAMLHILRVQKLRAQGIIWVLSSLGLALLMFPIRVSDSTSQAPHTRVMVTWWLSSHGYIFAERSHHLLGFFTQASSPIPDHLSSTKPSLISLYQSGWVHSHWIPPN